MKMNIEAILAGWLAGGPVQFCPNPGNAGDALIASATWQCFDRIGLRPEVVRSGGIRPGASVILGGGGNLVAAYRNAARTLETCLERGVERCLLLPHSINDHEELLGRLDARFTLVCREQDSFEHARRHATGATVLLADDMAMAMDFEQLARRTATLRHRLALRLDRHWRKRREGWRAALQRVRPDGDGRLTILRADCEAIDASGRDSALDLPQYYTTPCIHRAGCDQVAQDLRQLLGTARIVRTDRLHVALPAALLGLQVEMLDNSYGKLSGVWRNSLQGCYPNAHLL